MSHILTFCNLHQNCCGENVIIPHSDSTAIVPSIAFQDGLKDEFAMPHISHIPSLHR